MSLVINVIKKIYLYRINLVFPQDESNINKTNKKAIEYCKKSYKGML